MPLIINEIYKSIQGESGLAGIPCAFVRLTGCNLRCTYCDSAYAYNDGKSMTIDQIFVRAKSLECHMIGVTGGEPLLQDEVYYLVKKFLAEQHLVLIETNGSVDLTDIASLRRDDRDLRIILDLKTPGSGMSAKINWDNLAFIREKDEIKFVINDREDYNWSVSVLDKYHLNNNKNYRVLFSPVHGKLNPAALSGWILRDRLQVRLNLQLHKLMWGEEMRGV